MGNQEYPYICYDALRDHIVEVTNNSDRASELSTCDDLKMLQMVVPTLEKLKHCYVEECEGTLCVRAGRKLTLTSPRPRSVRGRNLMSSGRAEKTLLADANKLSPIRAAAADVAAPRAARLAAGRAPGLLHQRHGGFARPVKLPCAVCGRRPAQSTLSSGDDGEGARLRLCDRGVFVAQAGQEAA
ncbi:hypothetical protein AWB78_02433 [Caballeronia calidae]|uniref:Uncharacterized protein n=1 Tax=Caballeronia calidae TaxID=1777139 RepID=A0A158B9F3_9BURK|nr:hypothetical protein AWB78_02433 [Caballeronia calidae]